jgi:Uncharacterized protein conserved in bacteria (DUF2059)
MMRTWMIAGLLATSSMAAQPAPAWADDDVPAAKEDTTTDAGKEAQAIEAMTKMFSGLFDNKDATPIDPARLALAEPITKQIMPDGIYSRIMKDMTDKIFGALFSTKGGMSDLEIMLTTGVEIDGTKFDEAKRKAVTDLLDPNHAERSTAMSSALNPMFDKMAAAVEGPLREGLARAYARKFSADQLNELTTFFATPTGSFYASESFALQADPEVMQAVFSALPQMMEGFSNPDGIEKDIEAKMAAIPEPRKLADLSDKEIANLAKLLGTTSKDLKAYKEGTAVEESYSEAAEAGAEAAAEGAMAAADGASEDPFANDSGTEPWWNRENWEAADRKRVEALEAESSELSAKSTTASDAAFNAETEVMLSVRERYLKQGWKPSESSE